MELQNLDCWQLFLTTVSAGSMFLLGHNFWIAARIDSAMTTVELITSDTFPDSDATVKPERIKDFRIFTGDNSRFLTDYEIAGKTLTARIETDENADFAALELRPHPIVLAPAKFAGYIAAEAAEMFVAPDFVGGETTAEQRESYAKFAKTLFNNRAHDRIAGHRFEIVLQNDPARLETGEKLKVKVLFDNAPLQHVRVSSGAENLNAGKLAAHARTDQNGCAEIEIAPTGLCFVRSHFIRRHFDLENFEWESFWASLTFRR